MLCCLQLRLPNKLLICVSCERIFLRHWVILACAVTITYITTFKTPTLRNTKDFLSTNEMHVKKQKQAAECAGSAEKPVSLWPTTNSVVFFCFGCSYGYATLQPHCRPSAKNTINDCASWKAKSTTLNTWSGRKTTRSVTPNPTTSPIP